MPAFLAKQRLHVFAQGMIMESRFRGTLLDG
jgi:hypothetical protein